MRCRRRARGVVPLVLVALALSIALAQHASAHAYLESSTPAPLGQLEPGATVLALRFTERLDVDHSSALLTNATDPWDTVVDHPPSRPSELRVLTDPLVTGTYRLRWDVVSVDGHRDRGDLWFTVGEAALPSEAAPMARDPETDRGSLILYEGASRAAFLAGTMVALGIPVFLSEVLGTKRPPRRHGVTIVAGAAGAAFAAVLHLHAIAQGIGITLLEGLGTTAGGAALLKAAIMGLAAVAASLALRERARARASLLAATGLLAGLALVVHSTGGHGVLASASRETAAGHIAMTLHLVAAAIWVGGVVGFALAWSRADAAAARSMLLRFSPLALVSVLFVSATGLYEAWVHVPSLAGLDTPYGALLIAKTTFLVVLLAWGALLRYRFRSRFDERKVRERVQVGLSGEVGVMALTVLAAGILGATPIPAEPPDVAPGPVAAWEAHTILGDHDAHLAIKPDPVRANQEQFLTLRLIERTSRPAADERPWVSVMAPNGTWMAVDLQSKTGGSWEARLTFPTPGQWQLVIGLPPMERDDGLAFPVLVQPAATPRA